MRYRNQLPQLNGTPFLTDGGLETTLIFHDGLDLPDFAAFDLLRSDSGREALRRYYRTYLDLAARHDVGFVAESATWRANLDWGTRLGYSDSGLADMNRRAIEMLHDLRDTYDVDGRPVVISGCLGPRGDGYRADARMEAAEAEQYHREQVGTLAAAGVDMITALTMTYIDEAVGIVRAGAAAGVPVAISFTVETDGRLPSGETLPDAVQRVDEATGGAAVYYMINCAHPTHFAEVVTGGGLWTDRIRGLRANASARSHAELDEASELDDGDPAELGAQYRALRSDLRHLTVFGGCCGTDHRHLDEIARAVLNRGG